MSRRRRSLFASPGFVTLIAAALLVAGAAWAWVARQKAGREADLDDGRPALAALSSGRELPALGRIPDFSLTASDRSTFGRSDLDGAPWVANFIFTSCAGVCPLMSTQLAQLQEALADDSPVRFVSISVDPKNDTPEVLSDYARRFGARAERWVFLTGDPLEIYELAAEGFHLGAGELPDYDPAVDDGPFFHSSRLALVDAEGWIRGYYEGTESEEVERLAQDLARLTR